MDSKARAHGALFVIIALAIVAADQWTKAWVRNTIPLYTSWKPIPWLDPVIKLTHVNNTGAAFGILPNMSGVFIGIAVVAIVLIVVFYRRISESSLLLRIALGFQLGGAAGNLIDRIMRQGKVTDFVDVSFFPPVFNIADSSIVIGTALLAFYALFMDREREPSEDTAQTTPQPDSVEATVADPD